MNTEFNISDSLDGIDKDTSHPAKSPDRFVDQAPVLAALVHETLQGAGIAADDSVDGTIVYEAPLGEVAVYKVPADETISLENMVSVNGASTGLLEHEESENYASVGARSRACLWMNRVRLSSRRMRWYQT